MFPAGLENGELRAAVDLQVGVRVLHRVHVAGLAREIEQEVLPLHQVFHAVLVTDVRDIHPDRVLDLFDIEQVAAIFRDETVHKDDLRPKPDQTRGQVGADEPKTPRDKDAFPGKKSAISHGNLRHDGHHSAG